MALKNKGTTLKKYTPRDFLTVIQQLLYQYYLKTGSSSSDIALIGGDIQLPIDDYKDNRTLDPGMWYEWLEAIDGKKAQLVRKRFTLDSGEVSYFWHAIDGERELPKKNLTVEKGYNAAIRFLTRYAKSLESKDIKEFVNELTFDKWQEICKKKDQPPQDLGKF